MTKPFGKKTRPAATTGACPQPASRGVTQYYAENIIPFPALTSLPDNSRASERELFIQDEMSSGLACALAVLSGFFAVAIGAGLFIGSLIFNFFDLG